MLQRDELTPERIDRLITEARAAGFDYFISHAERRRRLDETLKTWTPGTDAWVFAYGSLMWNPAFNFVERRPARLDGYRRSFCFWTPLGRGTPEKPGLMLGLEPGGTCDGMAYRVAADAVPTEFAILYNREMLSGVYDAIWAEVADPTGERLRAVAFVVNPEHPQYCGALERPLKCEHIAFAEGRRGTCREYLFECADQLRGLGVRDPYIESLEAEVLRVREGSR